MKTIILKSILIALIAALSFSAASKGIKAGYKSLRSGYYNNDTKALQFINSFMQ